MATTFYPFVENGGCSDDSNIAQPSTSARIAVYDDMSMPPRVVLVEPSDITSYLSNITQTVYELVSQKCDEWPFMVIRELVENYIHALFIEPSISILDKGRTIIFSDQGPGIANKEASRGVGFSSATPAMKKYIRGVGSGFPIVENHMKTHNGTIRIEDNLGHGTIVTVSLGNPAASQAGATQPAASPQPDAAYPHSVAGYQPQQPAPMGQNAGQMPYGAAQQPYGYPQQNAGAGMGQGYPNPAYAPAQAGYPNPYAQAAPWPGQPGAVPPQPMGVQYPQYTTYGVPNNGGYNPYYNNPAQPQVQGYQPPYPAQPQPQAWGTPAQAPIAPEPPQNAAGIGAHVPLTNEERDILRVFGLVEKVGPTELNKRLGLSAATGSRKLGELAKAGYVTKNGQKYVLTGEGERVLAYLTNGEV